MWSSYMDLKSRHLENINIIAIPVTVQIVVDQEIFIGEMAT